MTDGARPRAPDPVGLAATAAASAIAAGLAVVTATVLGVRTLRPAESQTPDLGLPFYLLLFGTLGGIVVAGSVAWSLLAPIGSTYRRGGLALVSAFATVVLMLVCMPIDQWLGPPGLIGLLALCSGAALFLARRARHAATP